MTNRAKNMPTSSRAIKRLAIDEATSQLNTYIINSTDKVVYFVPFGTGKCRVFMDTYCDVAFQSYRTRLVEVTKLICVAHGIRRLKSGALSVNVAFLSVNCGHSVHQYIMELLQDRHASPLSVTLQKVIF